MTWRGTQNLGDHKQHRRRTTRRRQQRIEGRTVAGRRQTAGRAGRPLVEEARQRPQGAHQTRLAPARPNACAVTRTHARSCTRTPAAANALRKGLNRRVVVFANTGGRQRNLRGTTELRPLRGHPTMCEAVKIACKTTNQPHPGTPPDTSVGSPRLQSHEDQRWRPRLQSHEDQRWQPRLQNHEDQRSQPRLQNHENQRAAYASALVPASLSRIKLLTPTQPPPTDPQSPPPPR